ncbi:MAG TPA: bifunctional nuclease domain-containing protein [Candidatus Binataceae bacterium]|nr:bifunctional nuclease domain-containing protein [Candidatus Binataceae bacterium]
MGTRPAKSIILAATAAIIGSCALLACLGDRNVRSTRNEVRVKVTDVGFDENSNSHYVTLEDQNGSRAMPIMIGEDQARTIMLELSGIKPDRPLTADLLRNVIVQTGNHVDRVVIDGMRNQVFYAEIYLDHAHYVVDSRPSDAIALAMAAQAPIYVSSPVFDASAQELGATPPQFSSRDGITVQDLAPAIAAYFGVPPSSGVLVADLAPQAGNALKRGDIITQVDGRPVTNPAAFKKPDDEVPGTPFKLEVLRDGRALTIVLDEAGPQIPHASGGEH